MAEGWLVQEALVYVTEYLEQNDPHMPLLWRSKDDDRLVSEVPQGQGIQRKMNEELREKINRFCFLNCNDAEKWQTRYDNERERIKNARVAFRREHKGESIPSDLAPLPKQMPMLWLRNAIRKAIVEGQEVSEVEQEISMGCDWHVSRFKAYIYQSFF